jgi:hypothetical protein
MPPLPSYTYDYATADKTVVRRSDAANIQWNPQTGTPLDPQSAVAAQWILDGSPVPNAYVAPAPSADDIRIAAWLADVDRQNLVQQIANATPAQVKTYVNNNVTDLASAKVLLMKLILLVALTIRS